MAVTTTAVGAAAPEPNDREKALAIFKEMRDVLAPFPSSKFHHLIPTAFQERSDLWRPAVSVVQVNPEDQRDVYDTPGSQGQTVCLHSQALERIGNAMGIEWADTRYEHDHTREPFMCIAFVSGWMVDSLGMRRRLSASAKSDLRDGSVAAKISKPKQLDTARQFVCERTESRARSRAIKKVGDIPTSFTKDELRRPFVAVRFRLDERDPDVRRALIAQGTQAAHEVFGLPAGEPIDAGQAAPEEEIIEGEVSESRGGSSERAAAEPSRAERSGPPGEAAGSSPGPRSDEAEPPVPDAAAPTPKEVTDVGAIVAELRREADSKEMERERLEFARREELMDFGKGLIDLLGLGGKLTDQQRMDVRLDVLRAFVGKELPKASQSNRATVLILLRMLKDPEGQRRIRLVAAAAKVVG